MSVQERMAKVAAVVESLERDMELLCVTGVEDKLQEGVRPTLETLRNAGIKVGTSPQKILNSAMHWDVKMMLMLGEWLWPQQAWTLSVQKVLLSLFFNFNQRIIYPPPPILGLAWINFKCVWSLLFGWVLINIRLWWPWPFLKVSRSPFMPGSHRWHTAT